MKSKSIADLGLRIFVVAVLFAVLLLAVLRRHGVRGPDYCPIDGKQAQWTKRRSDTSCDYGHFSNVEKTAHTWSGTCQ
jgi:hypothetical protein